jgi:hypothetical protein
LRARFAHCGEGGIFTVGESLGMTHQKNPAWTCEFVRAVASRPDSATETTDSYE